MELLGSVSDPVMSENLESKLKMKKYFKMLYKKILRYFHVSEVGSGSKSGLFYTEPEPKLLMALDLILPTNNTDAVS